MVDVWKLIVPEKYYKLKQKLKKTIFDYLRITNVNGNTYK